MQLHEEGKATDIFYSPRNGGSWIVTRCAEATHHMTHPKNLSSARALVRPNTPTKIVPLVKITWMRQSTGATPCYHGYD